ncbi:MAG TPA: choice-of-anchor Q domain-containing protein [Thermoanaerobaculia bacterium]|nr:choice-of-anchor Q domain-containing protein [Thermoanaerobaculia bacterium]
MSDTGVHQTRLTRRQRRALARKAAKPGAAALALGVAMAAAPAAQAATFTVTNLDDDGPGSLRDAIGQANALAGPDTIDFQAGLAGVITLASGQLAITDSVDIQGPGASVIAVNGNTGSRVFYLYNGSALLDVTISGLTITGGEASSGAGIFDNDENLVLDGVTITGNSASGDGGGLWASGLSMNLTLRDSTVSGNTADDTGGGIYVGSTGGPLLIQRTLVSGNLAGTRGGGVYFSDPDGAVTLDQSTVSGNTAGSQGGGIYLYSTEGGPFTIQNSTISGNNAVDGAGAFFYAPDDPVIIENTTVSGNTATGTGGGIHFYDASLYTGEIALRHSTIAGNTAATGGGVYVGVGPVTVDQTIVGDNTADSGPDLANGSDGSFNLRFSLIEAPGTANLNDGGGNILNQDPQLGPLADNGGATQTHLPAGTSPALNAGDPAFTPPPSTDQRGFPRVVGSRIDIGSVEVGAGTVQFSLSGYTVNENGVTATITVTREGGTAGAVSVSYQTSNGTAIQPADYQTAAGTLNWANGDAAPKTFQVTIVDDVAVEGNETVNLALSNPQGATLGSPATAVLTILDNDVAATASIPTLGDAGKLLFAGLCGAAALLFLRRRKLSLEGEPKS